MHKYINSQVSNVIRANNSLELKKNIMTLCNQSDCSNLSVIKKTIRANDIANKLILEFLSKKIAILSNCTVDNIFDYLDLTALSVGINLSIYYPGFDQYQFEIINDNSGLHQYGADYILLLIDESAIFNGFKELSELSTRIDDFSNRYLELLSQLRQKSSAAIVINTIAFSHIFFESIIDYESKNKLLLEMLLLNQKIIEFSCANSDVIVLDTNIILQSKYITQLRDERLSLFAKMQFDDKVLYAFAKETIKILQARIGLTKKCIVLDLDNTIWGGILGDDGITGIDLGVTISGNEFKQLQHILKRLKQQGVLLAVSSKNDENNVKNVFLQHPEMILHWEDFISIRANWQDKHTNVMDIAQTNNFSTNAMIFLDDNEVECSLIEQFIPDINIICAKSGPLDTITELLLSGYFNKVKSSKEDLMRTQMYHSENTRKKFLSSHSGSLNEFLKQLNTQLNIFFAATNDLPRIYQICQRTNQFNLTSQRYTELELNKFFDSRMSAIIAVDVRDKFGPYGMVAVAFIRIDRNSLIIENIILSCRVFSRGIETALMTAVLKYAKSKNIGTVQGRFTLSAKNSNAQNFYLNENFELESNDGINSIFKMVNFSIREYSELLTVYEQLT